MTWRGVIPEHETYLPLTDKTPRLTLLEGGTPLIPVPRLSSMLGDVEVFVKFEGLNPTGSFKDRGMVMAVAKAVENGAKAVVCASTGNTAASAAAYAARAGIDCIVVIPDGQIAMGKLAQALFYGARVLALQGNFDQALELVQLLAAERKEITLVNSVNPYRLEGQKTAAFEVVDTLGGVPDVLCLPVGNAGNISAYWKGFKEYRDRGKVKDLPMLWGVQAEGAAPIVRGEPVPNPKTVATAIQIGNPASWSLAVSAAEQSGGDFRAVSDDEILEAQRLLASTEGIFVEPASAAPIAGLFRRKREGELPSGLRIVCVATGNGLKDPAVALKATSEPDRIPATLEALEAYLTQ